MSAFVIEKEHDFHFHNEVNYQSYKEDDEDLARLLLSIKRSASIH